jgi:membrane-bound lytic murein transglycosylase D
MERINIYFKTFLLLLSIFFLTSCASPHRLSVVTEGAGGAAAASGPLNNDNRSSSHIDTGRNRVTSAGITAPNLAPPVHQKEGVKAVDGRPYYGNGIDEDEITLKDLPEIQLSDQVLKDSRKIGNDELIESELKRLLLEFGDDSKEVPEIFLNEIKAYIRIFQTNPQYRGFITASLKRSAQYMSLVKGIFSEKGIPEDMVYIAFIESGFNKRAKSRVGALGMWQFMPKTARGYSLKVSSKIDERLDPIKSTQAAVDYFHDLIAIFGPRSFLLALAAYNCGEGKIIYCLKKIDNPFEERNFWHIRGCLAKETREYPPKIIAAAIIGNNPEVFGFPRFRPGPVEDEDVKTLMAANDKSTRKGMLPIAHKETQEARKEVKYTGKSAKKEHVLKTVNTKPIIYTPKKGNTLSMVADAFNVGKNDIKKWNGLKNDTISAQKNLKIYTRSPVEKIVYKVRKGDSITEISESFRVRPVQVITCNGLKNGWQIKPGQSLVFFKEIKQRPVVYTVQKGTKLAQISHKYNVTVKNLMMWNSLDSSIIHPQQKLRIYQDA